MQIIENWQLRHAPGTPHCTGFCRALPIYVKQIDFEIHQKSSKLINYSILRKVKCGGARAMPHRFIYRATLLILQHKYGHESIVILAQFLSKMAIFL